MEKVFSGLYLYEIVLLFLGIILFLILSVGLMYYIIKKEQVTNLLLFFTFPIIMIAYPSIKEINISKDKISLATNQERLINNPEDTIAKRNVEELTRRLEDRATSTQDLVQISKSHLLLGNNDDAIKFADVALTREESNENAQSVRRLATVMESIETRPEITTSVAAEETQIKEVKVSEDLTRMQPYLIRRTQDRTR